MSILSGTERSEVQSKDAATTFEHPLTTLHSAQDARTVSTVVLGLGNALRGDDGVGPAVIEWLEQQGLPGGVEAIDGGTAGLDIVSTLIERERAIIVDAANVGRAPGEWVRFTPDVTPLKDKDTTLSLHAAGLTEALALGAALKALPPTIIIYGVQPQSLDWSAQLSAEVQAAVPEVGQAILAEVMHTA
jgi:hydrogenase maturation protease